MRNTVPNFELFYKAAHSLLCPLMTFCYFGSLPSNAPRIRLTRFIYHPKIVKSSEFWRSLTKPPFKLSFFHSAYLRSTQTIDDLERVLQDCFEHASTNAEFAFQSCIVLSGLRTYRFTVFRGSKSGTSSLICAPIWSSKPRRNASNPQRSRKDGEKVPIYLDPCSPFSPKYPLKCASLHFGKGANHLELHCGFANT